MSPVARIEDCYVTVTHSMHVYRYLPVFLNVLKPYAFHLSNCTKKIWHASKTSHLLLFAVLNLPRGVNLHEIQYEHDSFLHNSKTYISPSQWPFTRRYGTAGTSRLLKIFYIFCLAITWISTEMKFKPISKYVLYI